MTSGAFSASSAMKLVSGDKLSCTSTRAAPQTSVDSLQAVPRKALSVRHDSRLPHRSATETAALDSNHGAGMIARFVTPAWVRALTYEPGFNCPSDGGHNANQGTSD